MSTGLAPKTNVFSGARALFKLHGQIVGYATSCSGSEDIQYEAVEVLNHLQVVEYVPVAYRVSMTAARIRLIGDAAGAAGSLRGPLGAFAKVGNDDHELLINLLALIQDELVATIQDTISQKIFFNMESIVIPSKNFAITARGLVGEDITLLGIRAKDEIEA